MAGAAIVVVSGFAIAAVARGSADTSRWQTATAASLAAKLAAIPAGTFHAVGPGSTVAFPLEVDGPPLTRDGKPRVLYMGAEYCPYCATERWAIITALSRFGRFQGLHLTHSAFDDTFPNTQTFTFHASRYDSPYVSFETVEMTTNQPAAGSYTKLETPTREQRQLMSTYGGPPYFPPSASGGIPFIDIAGRYVVSGASYDPTVLQGKSAAEITNEIASPATAVSRGAIGTANALAAAICDATGNVPASVCSDPVLAHITPRFR